jgi:hypothetical protein
MGDDASIPFGDPATGRWNPAHFLDLAEFTSAFGIAYDWFHDGFSDDQKTKLRDAIVTNGLNYCQASLTGASSASSYSWWCVPAECPRAVSQACQAWQSLSSLKLTWRRLRDMPPARPLPI